MATWQWDGAKKEYTGIPAARLVELRDRLIDSRFPLADDLAGRLADGGTVNEWLGEMRQAVQDAYVAQYLLGRGGRNQLGDDDWTWLAGAVAGQFAYLQAFAGQIQSNPAAFTQPIVASRSQLYFEASKVAFEEGRAAAFGLPVTEQEAGMLARLPDYPGSGRTRAGRAAAAFGRLSSYPTVGKRPGIERQRNRVWIVPAGRNGGHRWLSGRGKDVNH